MVLGLVQRTARQGGNPPLLIAADQEGGEVKRLSDGPPDLSLPQMERALSPAADPRSTMTARRPAADCRRVSVRRPAHA